MNATQIHPTMSDAIHIMWRVYDALQAVRAAGNMDEDTEELLLGLKDEFHEFINIFGNLQSFHRNQVKWTLMESKEYGHVRQPLDRVPEAERDVIKLQRTLIVFHGAMDQKLRQKAKEGYSGWDDPEMESYLKFKMLEHTLIPACDLDPDDYIDIANFAMMLWNLTRQEGEDHE